MCSLNVGVVVVLAVVCSLPVPAEARRGGAWTRELRLAEKALRRCPKLDLADELPYGEDLEMGSSSFSAKKKGNQLALNITHWGNGVDGVHQVYAWRVDLKRCTYVQMAIEWPDGTFCNGITYGAEGRARPSPAERRQLVASEGWDMGTPGQPADGVPALLCTTPVKGKLFKGQGWTARLHEANQPWFKGRPKVPPGLTVWPGLGGYGTLVASSIDAVKVVARPGSHEVYYGQLGGRARAQVVALYNKGRKRHRWLLHAISGPVRWIGQAEGLIFGVISPTHPVYFSNFGFQLFVIDIKRGALYWLYPQSPDPTVTTPDDHLDDPTPPLKVKGGDLLVTDNPKKPFKIPIAGIRAGIEGPQHGGLLR